MNNAYLYVDGFKFPITYFDFNLRQFKGTNNRPRGKVHGGEFSFTLDFDNKNTISLIAWMISPNMQKDGYIEILDFANSSIAFKLEFANAYATAQEFYYSAFSNLPLQTNVTITAGALRFDREVPFFQTWNPNNSFTNQSATVVNKENDVKKLSNYYLTDKQGNKINSFTSGDIIVLNIETQNRVGDITDIDMNNDNYDFKYNGNRLKNYTLKNVKLTSDLKKIELEVINQK